MRNMNALRLLKPRDILVMAFSVFFTVCCILLINSSKPKGGTDLPLLLKNPQLYQNSESNELLVVLRRASMEDRTVILTMIFDKAWARPGSVLDLFLESFRLGQETKRLLNHLVIITLGSQAFRHCNAMHPHRFQPKPYGRKEGPLVLDHLMVQRKTNDLLLQVLKLGYSFVFTEADVMWLRSPFADIHPSYEITIPCDSSSDALQNRSNKQGRGLFHVRANARTTELLRYWKVWGTLYPNSSVESLCEVLKDQQEVTEMFDMRIKYLDASYFGGFCWGGSKNISEAYTLQANCCDNVEEKVYDLRLVLEDWKIFKAWSIKNNSGIVPSLRSPTKCMA